VWDARLREGDCGDDVVGWTDTETGRYCRLEGPGTDMSGICKLDDGSTMLMVLFQAEYVLRIPKGK